MPNKALFQDDSMQKLFKDLTAISEHTNYLRNGMTGFVNQLDGQLLSQISGQTSVAQTLINQLTTRAENMEGFIQFAMGQMAEAELKNKTAAASLTEVSVKKGFWGKLLHGAESKLGAVEKKVASGLHNIATTLTDTNPLWLILAPIPTLLLAIAKSFKVKMKESTFEARLGKLKEDNQVAYLLKLAGNGTEGEKKWAIGQIEQIINALDEIGRCQAAYAMYAKFGNQPYKDGAHKAAISARDKLGKLNVSSAYYEEGIDFSDRYNGSPLLACHYNPMKSDHTELPADNQLRYLIATSALKDGMGKWAKAQIVQIEALYAVIGNAQKALQNVGDKSSKAKEESKITEAHNKLIKDFHLDAKSIDGVDFIKYDIVPETIQSSNYDMSGSLNLKSNAIYIHAKELVDKINQKNINKFEFDLKAILKIYEEHKDLYVRISQKTGIPPQLIAAIHYRESPGNFNAYLQNGDPLGKPTTHVPVGIYFDNFEDAAVAALLDKKGIRDQYKLSSQSNDMIAMLSFAESYNGLGYF